MRVINDSLVERAPFIISIQIVFMDGPSFGTPGRLPHEYEIRENYQIMYEALGVIKYVFVLFIHPVVRLSASKSTKLCFITLNACYRRVAQLG